MLEWIQANTVVISVGWFAIVTVGEFLKYVIPGNKDDQIIIKILDLVNTLLTMGGIKLFKLPEGMQKTH